MSMKVTIYWAVPSLPSPQTLSRAFRNRFIELHYDDLPSKELVTILELKCKLPLSYARKMVAVMKDLQVSYHVFSPHQ